MQYFAKHEKIDILPIYLKLKSYDILFVHSIFLSDIYKSRNALNLTFCMFYDEIHLQESSHHYNHSWDFYDNNLIHNAVYPIQYAQGLIMLYLVVFIFWNIMDSGDPFTQILQGCFTSTGTIISCDCLMPANIFWYLTTTKQVQIMCIILGMYCILVYK